jgi:hypothetical protein
MESIGDGRVAQSRTRGHECHQGAVSRFLGFLPDLDGIAPLPRCERPCKALSERDPLRDAIFKAKVKGGALGWRQLGTVGGYLVGISLRHGPDATTRA